MLVSKQFWVMMLSCICVQAWLIAQVQGAEKRTDMHRLVGVIQEEVKRAEEEGYSAHYARFELSQCERLLRAGDEKSAREHLPRAKGALVNIKLPGWSREFRFARRAEVEKNTYPLRGVFFWGRGFALPGFRRWGWWAGNCRPHEDAVKAVDGWHRQGRRILIYLEGTLTPQSYALLPGEWSRVPSNAPSYAQPSQYALRYTHHGERWWAMSGGSSGWRKWMADKMAFAARLGFDGLELDSAFGPYYEATEALQTDPFFVMCPNDGGRVYIDVGDRPRYGMAAMCEGSGVPYRGGWDKWHERLRRIARKAYNVPIWGYLYDDAEGFVSDLAFATELADEITDVCMQKGNAPSPEYLAFSRRFAPYLYGSDVDVHGPNDAVTWTHDGGVRCLLNRRRLISGKEDWVLHVINTNVGKREVKEKRKLGLELDLSEYDGKRPPAVTLLTPEKGAREVKASIEGRSLTFTLERLRIWAVVVVGERLFPRVSLKLASRGGQVVTNPLDGEVVPGEPFEVVATVEELLPSQAGWRLGLKVPKGWQVERVGGGGINHCFRVTPARSASIGDGYAVTPIVHQDAEAMADFPLQLKVRPKVRVRLVPPYLDTPVRKPVKLELEAKNNSRSGKVRLQVTPPKGWKMEGTRFARQIGAGKAVRFPIKVVPKDYGLTLWDYRDEDVRIAWQVDGEVGEVNLPVRLFPATFEVYSRGAFLLVMHGYPNLVFKSCNAVSEVDFALREKPLGETVADALAALKKGRFVTLWLVNERADRATCRMLEEFIRLGGGVVWQGKPFDSDFCPADGGRTSFISRSLTLVTSPLTSPIMRFKADFAGRFSAWKVRAKSWADAMAVWDDNSAAIVASRDPGKRVVYIGSDLATNEAREFHEALRRGNRRLSPQQISEIAPIYDVAKRSENLWYLTYLYYNLLRFAAKGTTR